MKRKTGVKTVATLVGLACAGAVVAQQLPVEELPPERTRPATCNEVEWSDELKAAYPNIVDACQEAVVVDGKTWARFSASFEEVEEDGEVRFQIRNRYSGNLGDVTIEPAPGQVAYINERRTPFDQLTRGQRVNLYVPEGHYGFASLPGAPMNQVAGVSSDGDPGARSSMYAQAGSGSSQRSASPDDADPVLAQLPATAGPLPWLAIGGALSLLGGIGVGLRRRFQAK
ncbi:MAG: LPXTG cell wall anchor domain-containing protein [Gammaproteobacteria bacterium]